MSSLQDGIVAQLYTVLVRLVHTYFSYASSPTASYVHSSVPLHLHLLHFLHLLSVIVLTPVPIRPIFYLFSSLPSTSVVLPFCPHPSSPSVPIGLHLLSSFILTFCTFLCLPSTVLYHYSSSPSPHSVKFYPHLNSIPI